MVEHVPVVCVWHVASRTVTSQTTLEAQGLRKPPLVWAVLLLNDMAVVTGDSSGHVTFVDGRHGTLVQSFGSHQADVLALAASADQCSVFASGVDHKVVLFSPQPEAPPAPAYASSPLAFLPAPPRRWLLSCSRRPHTHDVRALGVGEPRGAAAGMGGDGGGPLLISAGIDTQLCALRLNDFERGAPLKMLPFPQRGAYSLAPARRLMLCQEPTSLQLWQLPAYAAGVVPAALEGKSVTTSTDAGGEFELSRDEPRQLLLLKPKLPTCNLRCSAISPDCAWIACSDSETRLYALTLSAPHEAAEGGGAGAAPGVAPRVLVRRVPLPQGVPAATCLAFSVDSRLLLLGATDGVVLALQLGSADGPDADAAPSPEVHVLRTPTLSDDQGGGGGGDSDGDDDGDGGGKVPQRAPLLQLALSPDGQWLATADAARFVRLFSLDSLALSATVPPLASPPTAIAFSPRSDVLAIASANKQLTLFDVDRGRLAPWSHRNPAPLPAIAARREVVDRIAFNPARPDAVVLCAQSWLCHVSLSDTPEPPPRVSSTSTSAMAAARDAAPASPNLRASDLLPPSAVASSGGDRSGGRKRTGSESKKRKRDKKREAHLAAEAEAAAAAAAAAGGGGEATEAAEESRPSRSLRSRKGGEAQEPQPEPAAKAAKAAKTAAGAAPSEAGEADADVEAGEVGEAACRMVTRYGPMLLFDYVAPDTAIVLERPWLRVMEHFPPTLHRPRFGT